MRILNTIYPKYYHSKFPRNYGISFLHDSNHPLNNKELDDIDYAPDALKLAKKYMYAKDPYNLIQSEIDKKYSNKIWVSTEIVTKLIQRLHELRAAKDIKIKDLDESILKYEKMNNEEVEKHKKLSRIIDEKVDKRDLERIKIAKILLREKRINKVCTELDEKYIDLKKLENKKYPNAIMVQGLDNIHDQQEVIKYLQKRDCKVYNLDFDNIPLNKAMKSIFEIVKYIKENDNHSILYINNFRKYTVLTDENFSFINKLKSVLIELSNKYNTTLLVFESNPHELDENIIGGHRFEKKINVSNIKGKNMSAFIPKNDGYTLVYGLEDSEQVDLYLGNYNTNLEVLWIDTKSSEKINKVIDNIEKIKKKELFKYVKYLEFEQPDNINAVKYDSYLTHRKSGNYNEIYYSCI